MGFSVQTTDTFYVSTCCSCGVRFAFTSEYERERRKDKAFFHCPNGHMQHFTGETAEDKLRRERDMFAQRVAQRDDEIKSLEARRRNALGQVTKLKRRVGNGVCPCCTRTFGNLQSHMKTEHPDFKAEAAE